MPIHQRTDTSKPAKKHKTYLYLLGGLRVEQPNFVGFADMSYIAMRRGSLHLFDIIDWHTRKVLAWRISNALEAAIAAFIGHYNNPRYNESVGKLTPANAQFDRGEFIPDERRHIKQQTIKNRRLNLLSPVA
jgi:hypothetical protein